MAFRIRRGLRANIGSMDPAPVEGELFYTTDTKGLYVGDDQGNANLVSSSVVKVNNQIGIVELTTDDIPEGLTNKWYTDERAQDATALALLGSNPVGSPDNSIHTRITFTYNDTTGRLSATVAPEGKVNVGSTNSLAYYTGNTAEVDDAAELKWNGVSKTLTLAESRLRITATFPTQYMTQFDSYGDDQYGGWMVFRRARGTEAEPAVTQNQDFNASIIWASYDASEGTTPGGYAITAGISAGSDGAPSGFPGYYPGWLVFSVTGNGKVLQDVGRWDQYGKLTIGPFYGNEQSTGALAVAQTVPSSVAPTVGFTNIYENTEGPTVFLTKVRGTQDAFAPVNTGDVLGDLLWSGKDLRPGRTTGYASGARIRSTVTGTVDFGIVPADLTISVANAAGILVDAINVTSTATNFALRAKFPDGTASAPSIAFTTDGGVDTGFSHPSDGVIVVSSNATEVARFDGGGIRSLGFIKVKNYGSDPLPSPPEAGMIVLQGGTFQGYTGSGWVTLG